MMNQKIKKAEHNLFVQKNVNLPNIEFAKCESVLFVKF